MAFTDALRILKHPGEALPLYQNGMRIASACAGLSSSSDELHDEKT